MHYVIFFTSQEIRFTIFWIYYWKQICRYIGWVACISLKVACCAHICNGNFTVVIEFKSYLLHGDLYWIRHDKISFKIKKPILFNSHYTLVLSKQHLENDFPLLYDFCPLKTRLLQNTWILEEIFKVLPLPKWTTINNGTCLHYRARAWYAHCLFDSL